MKERPILFSGSMVRALLAGTKTQTRRAVKLPHMNPLGEWEAIPWGGPNGGRTSRGETLPAQMAIGHTRTGDVLACPYGQPGDRLWVREAWMYGQGSAPIYRADTPTKPEGQAWRSSIHMPRAASRITLEVVGVRVERLQDISEEDAKAEGAWGPDDSIVGKVAEHFGCDVLSVHPSLAFRMLWEQINSHGSWAANPWVWVVEFKRIEQTGGAA